MPCPNSVSPDYLEATTVVCAAARELPELEVLVNMSQMTVSQMTAASTEESHQQQVVRRNGKGAFDRQLAIGGVLVLRIALDRHTSLLQPDH